MPKIKLSDGTSFHYKTKPIYLGVKRIDKEIALENLCVLKRVLDKRGVEFQLTYGSLLGAIREKDFITHDEDIDLLVMDENKQCLFDALPELKGEGFDVARYDRIGLLSIYRKGEYIDFYFYSKRADGTRYCRGSIFPCEMLEETTNYGFKGLQVKIPVAYNEYLSYVYGEDWRIPVAWFNYEVPKWKKLMLSIKSVVKDLLPYKLFVAMVRARDLRIAMKYEKKLKKYRENHSISVGMRQT